MKITILGCSGSEVPGHNTPAFLIDGKILLDAGTVGPALNIDQEHGIRHVLLTHAHFDHIKGIPFFIDNIVIRNTGNSIAIMSGKDVLEDLKSNIFNGRIWPDFSRLPTRGRPALVYKSLQASRIHKLDGYTVIMERVHHTVPAYGFIVEKRIGESIAYTGDTGPTDRIWKKAAARKVRHFIIETSFPNRLEKVALASGHLTPSLLGKEIAKISNGNLKIFVMHLKPQFHSEI